MRLIFDKLKPSRSDIERLALRETDARAARSFEPIAAGPAAAVLLLTLIGAAGIILAPLRLFASILGLGARHGR